MNKTALRHMMLHSDTLADEYDAILGYRTSHAGLVQAVVTPWAENQVYFNAADRLVTTDAPPLAADIASFTLFCSLKIIGSATTAYYILDADESGGVTYRLHFARNNSASGYKIRFRVYDDGGGVLATCDSTTGLTNATSGQPKNIMVSGSIATGVIRMYWGDTAENAGVAWTAAAGFGTGGGLPVDRLAIGGVKSGTTQKLDGNIGSLWFKYAGDDSAWLDPAVEGNRRLFFDAGGAVVEPPSGAQIYFGGTQVAADWNAGTNQGSWAGFTMTEGAVTDVA